MVKSVLMGMQTTASQFQAAVRWHQQGNLPQASAVCRQILMQDKRHGPSLHLLGLIAHLQGNNPQALQYLACSFIGLPHFLQSLISLFLLNYISVMFSALSAAATGIGALF